MKTENTSVNKKIFASLYFNQNVMRHPGWDDSFCPIEPTGGRGRGYVCNPHWINEEFYLELKDFSLLTEENKKQLEYFLDFKMWDYYSVVAFTTLMDHAHSSRKSLIMVIDYLRKEGFAIDWYDLTVGDMVEYGWIKIRK